MIQFAEFNLLERRPSHGPVIKNSQMVNHGLAAKFATDLLLLRSLGRLLSHRIHFLIVGRYQSLKPYVFLMKMCFFATLLKLLVHAY